MNRRAIGLTAACVAALIGLAVCASAQSSGHYPGRLLVRFGARTSEASAASIVHSMHGTLGPPVGHTGYRIVNLTTGQGTPSDMSALEAAAKKGLAASRAVDDVEYDLRYAPADTPNDPSYASQWHLAKIACPTAWTATHGSSSVVIAILDTGVDSTHPDLAPKMVSGWNVYDNNSNTADVYGHGTATAGTAAAATNNGVGVAGVAWDCMLMPVRITDTNGYAYSSTASAGLLWAADNGARVANLSFAMTDDPVVESAAQYFYGKGGALTVAAGNGSTVDPNPDNPYEITVSATDSNDAIASWSNTGNNIDVAAPGVNVLTTCRGGTYGYWSGTSFSAPITAGVAALAVAVCPTLTGAQIKQIVENSADHLGTPGWNQTFGWGRVNAAQAVALAATYNKDTTPPTVTYSSPTNGSQVSGTVSIVVSATDNVGVTSVQLQKDGALVATLTASPYAWSYDTTADPNGAHSFTATAFDAAGNQASATLNVTVANSDATPPVVSFTSPAENSQVSGTVSIDVSATDNVGVASVQFKKDGVLVATMTTAPYTWAYDTTADANGAHTLTATAYDAAGNHATATLNLTVANADTTPPVVSFTSPTNGAQVSGTVSVAISATDNVGVTSVQLRKDGALIATWTAGPYAVSYDTTKDANGAHTLTATAFDAAGNQASATVGVTVANKDTTPPVVHFTSPANGAQVSGTVSIAMSATDNVGVASVQLKKDGVLVATMTASPYTWAYNSASDNNGAHSFTATAFDAAGNQASATLGVTVANKDTTPPVVSFLSPTNGAQLSGKVSVSVAASDNVGVASVQLKKDGVLVATLTAAPYTWAYDTTVDKNGTHTLTATAKDAAGNQASASVSYTVGNKVAPKVVLSSPVAGSVGATITIRASVTDSLRVVHVQFLVDGAVVGTCTMAPYTMTYHPTKGRHTVQALAVDTSGAVGYSSIVTITH